MKTFSILFSSGKENHRFCYYCKGLEELKKKVSTMCLFENHDDCKVIYEGRTAMISWTTNCYGYKIPTLDGVAISDMNEDDVNRIWK